MTEFDTRGTGNEFDDAGVQEELFDEERTEAAPDADAQEQDVERALGATEPGAEGPPGTGTEGADDVLEAERAEDRDPLEETEDSADYHGVFSEDLSTAAEQGNREGDEMVGEGHDNNQVADLAGDVLEVDARMEDGIEPVRDEDGISRVTDEFTGTDEA